MNQCSSDRVTMVRIAIVGGGVGGLSLARALNRLEVQNVAVFDRRPLPSRQVDRGLGLWDDSQVNFLSLSQLQLLKIIHPYLAFSQCCLRALDVPIDSIGYSIPPASYRNKRGTWLSRCSQTPENLSRVRSVSQNELLESLREGIEPSIVLGRELVGVRAGRESWELHFKTTETSASAIEEADILVGADGISSAVRSLIGFPGVKELTGGEYTYFSGIVNAGSGCPPFETLGPGCERALIRSRGLRFACVPLGAEKCLWFSSLPSLIAPEENCRSDGILRFLKDMHRDWHQPIPQLLERSLETGVDVLVEKHPVYVSPEKPYIITGNNMAAVLLGDSCHAVTPNLAQGAAVAIEDACDLAVCLKNNLEFNADASGMDQCLRSYVDSRRERCRSHAQMTAFTEALSQMNGVLTEPMRNMMAFVPRPLNSWIFDAALDRSMGNFLHQGAAHRLRRAIAAL